MSARLLAVLALVLCGCASRRGGGPPPLDAYANAGPLAVRGARSSAPGPTIVRSLRGDPRAGRLLAVNGEPETVEVQSVRGRGRRIVLTYRDGRDARVRRVVVEPFGQAHAASAPGRSTRSAAGAHPAEPIARGGAPTTEQSLACPIDPQRPDCRALCTAAASYEWCR